MLVIENQTIYQCEYCLKRIVTKSGAKRHEEKYCPHPASLNQKAIVKRQAECSHLLEARETACMPMPDETHLMQPSHTFCTLCGVGEE